MSTEKHITLTGSSPVSWKNAIVQTVEKASETLNNLSAITILEQKAKIENNKLVEYYVDLDIAFLINDKEENKGE